MLAPLIGISAVLIFNIKVYVYYKSENPDKSYILAYASGKILPYIFLSLFLLSPKNHTGNKNINRINKLTYVFYLLTFIAFALGIIGSISADHL